MSLQMSCLLPGPKGQRDHCIHMHRHTSETGRLEGIIHAISTRIDFINEQSLLSHALIKSLIVSIKQLGFNGSLARPDCCMPLGGETMSALDRMVKDHSDRGR